MNNLIPLMVIIPLTCALLLNLLSNNKLIKGLSFVVAITIPTIAIVSNYGLHYFGGYTPMLDNVTSTIYHPGITYSFNVLQKIFIALIGILLFLIVFIYLTNYKKASKSYLFLIFLGISAITAIILTDDIFNLYVFFEILVLAQVGIVAASSVENNYETALKYMILGSIGAPMLLLGIIFLLALTGSVNISDIVMAVHNGVVSPTSSTFLMACALILFGWIYASGLPPFHTIKAEMYSKAEPHAAALIQSFTVISMIAIAIIMIRIFIITPYFKYLVVAISSLAVILGISMALTQDDFMYIIGFLAVGELGFIGLGIGLGTNFSIIAGLFQALNEIVSTALLFIGFGAITKTVGETNFSKLGGLIADYPKTAILLLLGGLAMAGVPPFNGFQSKLMLVQALLNCGFHELAILVIIVSIATFLVFVRLFYMMFLKPKPKYLVVPDKKISRSVIFAMSLLFSICVILGLFPELVTSKIALFVGGLL